MHAAHRNRHFADSSEGAPTAGAFSVDQKRMVEFAIRWLPFGGGPRGEIFLEFGLSERGYYERLLTLVTHQSATKALGTADAESLIDLCTVRLTAVPGGSLTS